MKEAQMYFFAQSFQHQQIILSCFAIYVVQVHNTA